MLEIEVKGAEYWDEEAQEFIYPETTRLQLEHSLVSLSKWESKWEIPFLSDGKKSTEQIIDYIKCMSLTDIPDPEVLNHLDPKSVEKIKAYIEAKMTATWFSDKKDKKSGQKEVITSELIYYWMVTLAIPFECQYWHLNRLITLVEVCNRKNDKPKKMGKKEQMERNRSLNAQRKAQMNTPG